MSTTDPKSPCISICALNENDVCVGCFRSGREISYWGDFSAEEKTAVLKEADARRSAAQVIQLK